jgi:hypothetical protein
MQRKQNNLPAGNTKIWLEKTRLGNMIDCPACVEWVDFKLFYIYIKIQPDICYIPIQKMENINKNLGVNRPLQGKVTKGNNFSQ